MATSSFDRNVTIDNSNYKSLTENVNKTEVKVIDLSTNREIKLVSKNEIKNLFK